ncbi:DsbA family oxidoreductase [Pseudoalteromonas rubra]|uniref:2-hydroxychromene-2-carboxylate isomerase n=1 Tax=Pseudoalteromonas rubra TaxID=43658 RepID=A0A0U3HV62_9GAMM|nr:DsbA family oxidoreductase [Pseudoalteromonas rubra]ALU44904.1 2-hydroxychromene-2-carboxylate isomerase [Pseudoalteromonas rubra]
MDPIKPLKIDIISDPVCPWCAIGFYRLRQALNRVKGTLAVKISWHPFELNPTMAPQGENLRKHLAKKYGTTLEQSIRARKMLAELGKEVGFEFNYFDEMKMLNTHDCHRLLFWAKDSGLQTRLAEAMFEEFFSNRGDFSYERLLRLVAKLGLNSDEAKDILTRRAYSREVTEQQTKWRNMGIQAVPAVIFNNEKLFTGAQDVDTYQNVLEDYINQER